MGKINVATSIDRPIIEPYLDRDRVYCPFGLCMGTGIPPSKYEHDMGTRRPAKNKEERKEFSP